MTTARVLLWGRQIGAVTWAAERATGVFQYTREFARSQIEIAPLVMQLREAPYSFPELPYNSFHGLPGLLADSLPDKFGHRLIDAWLTRQGLSHSDFSPVDRLCYIGSRGMGALEFEPAIEPAAQTAQPVDIAALVDLANWVLDQRAGVSGRLAGSDDQTSLRDLLRVGTSAGGARAKALLAWHPQTGEFRSGQLPAPDDFEPWLLKFDGIHNNRDHELADPQGFGRIEYAYYRMASAAGIEMMPSRLHHEGGRSHFMTRRFDRDARGRKLHMQSLAGLCHFDYNQPGAYSYEQALAAMKRLQLDLPALEQQYRRTVFNILARNQDDHVKNIAFLMDKQGRWSLSPAFDVTYAWNPSGDWTGRHQMTLQGKQDAFTLDDLIACAEFAGIKKNRAMSVIDEVADTIRQWPDFADQAGVAVRDIERIGQAHRVMPAGR
ncbi:MAG: type II toxin-antitoxin system HipA family toxin [Wenzhouxiangellaceae bacterium]